MLREQTELFGPVASRPTAWRAVQAVASVELRAIPRAVAAARERVWAAAGLDLTSIVTIHVPPGRSTRALVGVGSMNRW